MPSESGARDSRDASRAGASRALVIDGLCRKLRDGLGLFDLVRAAGGDFSRFAGRSQGVADFAFRDLLRANLEPAIQLACHLRRSEHAAILSYGGCLLRLLRGARRCSGPGEYSVQSANGHRAAGNRGRTQRILLAVTSSHRAQRSSASLVECNAPAHRRVALAG